MITPAELKQQALLSDLNDAELALIAAKLTREAYGKGAKVLGEGEPTKGIFLVRSGKVEISKTTPDGWKQTLAVLTERQFFGELAVIEGRTTHSTNATALDSAELYRLKLEDYQALEQDQPQILYRIMKSIARTASRNVHMMNEKLMKALISY